MLALIICWAVSLLLVMTTYCTLRVEYLQKQGLSLWCWPIASKEEFQDMLTLDLALTAIFKKSALSLLASTLLIGGITVSSFAASVLSHRSQPQVEHADL